MVGVEMICSCIYSIMYVCILQLWLRDTFKLIVESTREQTHAKIHLKAWRDVTNHTEKAVNKLNNTYKYSRCGRPEKASSLIVVKEFAFRSLLKEKKIRHISEVKIKTITFASFLTPGYKNRKTFIIELLILHFVLHAVLSVQVST